MRAPRIPQSTDNSSGTPLRVLAAIPLLTVGLVLLAFASLSEAEVVGEAVFEGAAPPGQTLIPVNETGYGAATLQAPSLPCPLFVHPFSPVDAAAYQDDGEIPRLSLNCDRPNATVAHQVTHLLLRNVDPTDPQNYTVEIQFYRLTQPHLWLVFPAVGLLLLGTAIVVIWLLERGLGGVVEQVERRRREG